MELEKKYVVSHEYDYEFALDEIIKKEQSKFDQSFPANLPPKWRNMIIEEPDFEECTIRNSKDIMKIEDWGCDKYREIEVNNTSL